MAASVQREEILSLTGLRFLAALSVASAHGSSILGLGPTTAGYWVSTTAGFGMQLFFVLSGFVIHYNYRDAVTHEPGGKGRFLWARFARLIPLYAFMLFVDLISNTRYSLRTGSPDTVQMVIEALPYYLTLTQSWFYVLLGNTSIIYAILPTMELTWSVSTEWFFYLAYIPLVFLVVPIQRAWITLAAIVAFAAMWITLNIQVGSGPELHNYGVAHFGSLAEDFNRSFERWLLYFSPYFRIGEFLLGVLTAHLFMQLQHRKPRRVEAIIGQLGLLTAIGAICAIHWTLYSNPTPPGYLGVFRLNFGLAIPIAALIFLSARYPAGIGKLFSVWPMVILGEASYSIYLVHFPVFQGFRFVGIEPIVPEATAHWLRFFVILAAVFSISLTLYFLIEIPSRRWLRSLWSKRAAGLGWRRPLAGALVLAPVAVAGVLFAVVWIPIWSTPTVGIAVIGATYGDNCGAQKFNATRAVSRQCDGRADCTFVVSMKQLGNPGDRTCQPDFAVSYRCAGDGAAKDSVLPGGAGVADRTVGLACPGSSTASAF